MQTSVVDYPSDQGFARVTNTKQLPQSTGLVRYFTYLHNKIRLADKLGKTTM